MMHRTKLMITVACLIIMLVPAGCMDKNPPSEYATDDSPPSIQVTPTPTRTATPSPTPAKKDLEISSPASTPDPVAPSHASSKETDKDQKKSEKTASETNVTATPKPNYDITEPYDASKLKLMGFTLHDSASSVIQRFGNPQDTFNMDDPDAPIKVFEYPGFSIGFDNHNEIVFIAVSSTGRNPGLNGFRLGMSTADVINALGKPDSKTDYVLSYKSGGVVLKMDVNPTEKKVISIKLFAESE